jgi:hypothetical protein
MFELLPPSRLDFAALAELVGLAGSTALVNSIRRPAAQAAGIAVMNNARIAILIGAL